MLSIIRSGLYIILTSGFRLVGSFVVTKILAIYTGVSGVGISGQAISFTSLMLLISGGGVHAGLTKFYAQYKNEPSKQLEYMQVASIIAIFVSVVIAFVSVFFQKSISVQIFGDDSYREIIVLIAVLQMFFIGFNFQSAIINANRQVRLSFYLTAITIILGFALSQYALSFNEIIISALSIQILGAFIYSSYFLLKLLGRIRVLGFIIFRLKRIFFIERSRELLQYSLMFFVAAITVPVFNVVLRSQLQLQYDWSILGFWISATRISEGFFQVFSAGLSGYYYTKIVEAKSKNDVYRLVRKIVKITIPIYLAVIIAAVIFQDTLVSIFFSNDFLRTKEFLSWQLLGDLLKYSSQIFGFIYLAQGRVRIFVLAEIVQVALLSIITVSSIQLFGLQGVSVGYAFSNFLFLIFNGGYFYYWIQNKSADTYLG